MRPLIASASVFVVACLAVIAVLGYRLVAPAPVPVAGPAEAERAVAAPAASPAQLLPARSLPAPPLPAPPLPAPPLPAKPDSARLAPADTFEPVRRDIRNVTPEHVLPGPRIETATIERLPALVRKPKPKPPKPASWPRATVLSPGLVESGDARIAFAGIDALSGDAECRAEDGSTWPCGNFARAALQRLIRHRPIACDPPDQAEAGAAPGNAVAAAGADETVSALCRVSGRDIGQWLVAQGWARPLPGSGYDEALAAAKEAGRGQWRRDNPERDKLRPGVVAPLVPDIDIPDLVSSEPAAGDDVQEF